MKKSKLLVIYTKRAFQNRLLKFFEEDFEIKIAGTGNMGLYLLEASKPDVVLLGVHLPDMDGLEILKHIQTHFRHIKTMLLAPFQDMQSTIQAMQLGAYDYVLEDIGLKELEEKIKKAISIATLGRELSPVTDPESSSGHADTIIGQSQEMRDIYKFIGLVSNINASVGILGETGTGKELVARAIHQNSANRDEPFITVDCTTIVETLTESTLYGHEKGSFTGAMESHRGQFEIAGNGTIFLDEISELPLSLQGKLLRFLQEKEYHRVGGTEVIRSNARIIAATNKNLFNAVAQGRFRKDLYYRLSIFTIHIPLLRERKEDIPLLIRYFLNRIKLQYNTGPLKIEDRAVQRLMEYHWPGNVRELENLLTRACLMGRQQVIMEDTVTKIFKKKQEKSPEYAPVCSLEEAEQTAVKNALKATNGNLTQAAELLKTSRPTLRKKIHKYGITI